MRTLTKSTKSKMTVKAAPKKLAKRTSRVTKSKG